MSVTGEPDPEGRPLRVGVALIDALCGSWATIGVLAALQARERTGEGQLLEVSLMDTALAGLLNQASTFLNAGIVGQRVGNRHPALAPYETFAASDRDFVLAGGNDAIFARMCAVIGRPELAVDERYATNAARLEHRESLAEELAAVFATAPAGEWVLRLTDAGVPAGPINDIAQAFAYAEELGLDPVDDRPAAACARPLAAGPPGAPPA